MTRPFYTATTTDMLSPNIVWAPVNGLTLTALPDGTTAYTALFEPSPPLPPQQTKKYTIVVNAVDTDSKQTAQDSLAIEIGGAVSIPVNTTGPGSVHPV